MKKNLKSLIAVLGCSLLLSGCKEDVTSNNNEQNNSNNQQQPQVKEKTIFDVPVEDDVLSIDKVVASSEEIEETIEEKKCEEIFKGSCGGCLIDFMIGSYIEPSCTYNCTFDFEPIIINGEQSKEYTVMSDDRAIAQVSHEEGSGTFTIKGITVGDAIIQARNAADEVVLQFVVHVRRSYTLGELISKLYKTDVYYAMVFGNYLISFTEQDPLKGVMTGADDVETTNIIFNLKDPVPDKMDDFNVYRFKISVDAENSSSQRDYTYLYVTTTADRLFVYDINGIIDIFTDHKVSNK